MNGRSGVMAHIGDVKALKDVEDLDNMGAAGGGRRHGVDVVASVLAMHQLPDGGPIGFEVIQGDQAVVALHLSNNQLGGLPLVKTLWAMLCNALKGVGEVRL